MKTAKAGTQSRPLAWFISYFFLTRPSWITRDNSFRTYANFSGKVTFITPWYAQGVRNVSVLENFAYVINEWTPNVFRSIGVDS